MGGLHADAAQLWGAQTQRRGARALAVPRSMPMTVPYSFLTAAQFQSVAFTASRASTPARGRPNGKGSVDTMSAPMPALTESQDRDRCAPLHGWATWTAAHVPRRVWSQDGEFEFTRVYQPVNGQKD